MNDDLNTLIDELSSFEFASQSQHVIKEEMVLNEEDTTQYFLNRSKAIIEAGINAVQDITPYVVQSQDPKEISALAELMAATTQALDSLNKGNLINKKADRDEKLENQRLQGRKELAEITHKEKNVTNNMNVLVASREEIMNKLFGKSDKVLNLNDK